MANRLKKENYSRLFVEDRIFKYALMVSLVLHSVVLLRLSYANQHTLSHVRQRLEIVYPRIIADQNIREINRPLKGEKVALEQSTIERPDNLEPFVKDFSKISEDFFHEVEKPKQLGPSTEKRRVSVPALETQQITNLFYLNYYESVRGRIRERAYENYKLFDSGEVYLTFILDASGVLKEIKIIEDRTRANQNLRKVSLQSVKEASPFLPFPDDLKYPELSFNVIILFQVD